MTQTRIKPGYSVAKTTYSGRASRRCIDCNAVTAHRHEERESEFGYIWERFTCCRCGREQTYQIT